MIAIVHETLNANRIAESFRRANPPIIGRIQDERFLLDLRTIFDAEDLFRSLTETNRAKTQRDKHKKSKFKIFQQIL